MIRSEFVARVTGGLSAMRAASAEPVSIPAPPTSEPPPSSSSATGPDVAPGARVGSLDQTRRTRLALDPPVRRKLERLESSAAAARAEVFRLGDLIDGERQRHVALDQRYAALEANYLSRADKAEVDALSAERTICDEEIAQLTAQRDVAQQRWQQLNRLAERCRVHLGLPADGRRG
jgi:cell division protein FtsB